MSTGMRLEEALNYARENYQSLEGGSKSIVGVGYTPNDQEASFWFINVTLDENYKLEGEDYYCISIEGSHLSGDDSNLDADFGFETGASGEDIGELISNVDELKTCAKDVNYYVYDCNSSKYFGCTSEQALGALFPQLPDPDDSGLSVFKAKAIEIITAINSDQAHLVKD